MKIVSHFQSPPLCIHSGDEIRLIANFLTCGYHIFRNNTTVTHNDSDDKKKHGVTDAVAKRMRKFLCFDICRKFNHNTRNCYKNDDNWSMVEGATTTVLPVEDLNMMNNEPNSTEMAKDGQAGVV